MPPQNQGSNTPPPVPQQDNMPPQYPKMNTMAIVGFISTFIIPLVGFILCLIALSQIKKTGERGRGLAMAGVIIFSAMIVIIFLLAIVVATITGPTARNAASIASHRANGSHIQTSLEAYFAKNKKYPSCNSGFSEAQDCLDDSSINIIPNPKCPSGGGMVKSNSKSYTIEIYGGDCKSIVDRIEL